MTTSVQVAVRCALRGLSTSASKETLFHQHVVPKVQFLQSHGFTISQLREMFQSYTRLVHLSLQDDIQPVLDVLKGREDNGLHLRKQDICDMVVRHPSILGLSAVEQIQPLLNFWQRDMQFSSKEMSRLVIRAPQLLSSSINAIKSQMIFFHNRFANPSDLEEMFGKYPEMVNVPTQTLMDFHSYWMEVLMTDKDFIAMLTRHPSLLHLSFEQTLRPMIQYMIFICRHKRGALLFVRHPEFFEMPIDELSKKIEYLLDIGVSRQSIISVLSRHPQILHKDLERELKPRIDTFKKSGSLSTNQLAQIIEAEPHMIAESPPDHVSKSVGIPEITVHATSCPIF